MLAQYSQCRKFLVWHIDDMHFFSGDWSRVGWHAMAEHDIIILRCIMCSRLYEPYCF